MKNRVWFFGDFERMLHTRPLNVFTRVPTQREMGGDFSDLHTTAGGAISIYNTTDTFVDADGRTKRRPFANNMIPGSMINPFSPNLLRFWGPGPSNPGLTGPNGQRTEIGNLQLAETTDTSWTRADVKLDYQHTQKHKFMGRYSETVFTLPTALVYGTEADNDSLSNENNRNPGWNSVLSWTWTAAPTLMITQAFNYTFVLCDTSRVEGASGYDIQSLGSPFNDPELLSWVDSYAGGTAFPRVVASGYGRLGTTNTVDEPHHNFGYSLGLIKTSGEHTLKFVESRGSAPTVAGGSSRLPTGFRIAPVPQSPA